MTALKIRQVVVGSNTTTDAGTAKTLCLFDVATGGPGGTPLTSCSIFVTARCSGYDSTGNAAAGEWIGACFKVSSGGTLQLVGSPNHAISMIKDTGGAPNSDLSQALSSILYTVTGVAATTLDWFGGMEIFICKPA